MQAGRAGNGSGNKLASKLRSYESINGLGLESERNCNPQLTGESLLRLNKVDESLMHSWR